MTRCTSTKTTLDPLSTTLQKFWLSSVIFLSRLPPKQISHPHNQNTIIQNIEYINLRRPKSVKSNYQLAELWNGNFLGDPKCLTTHAQNIVNDAQGASWRWSSWWSTWFCYAYYFVTWDFKFFFQKELGTRCFLKTNTDLSGKNNYFIFDLLWNSDFPQKKLIGMWQKKSYQIKICLTGSWIIMSGHHDEWQRFLDMFLYNIFFAKL